MDPFSPFQESLRAFVTRIWPIGTLVLAAGAAQAGPVPANLGAGLREIVANRVAAQNPSGTLARERSVNAASSASEMMTVDTGRSMMRDASSRMLVDVVISAQADYASVRAAIAALPGVSISAEDPGYRSGIVEGFVPEDSLAPLAKLRGVKAVHAVVKPAHSVGAVTQQGVVQHRVDRIRRLDGTGITVGILSDSYNTAQTSLVTNGPLRIREADDIASGDLPGPGNPLGNVQPVVVLKDFLTYPQPVGFDEGRGMAQLIHDMAPKARLGFATADDGEVAFANNIRALAGIPGLPNSRADFAAQIIVDDVQYFDEGMFSDTVVAQAVDDVTARGVSYFSSAGNTPPTQGYASDLRIVAAGANPTAGTNINLRGVPATLYAGGFHNFRSDGGQDIAQTVTLDSRQLSMVLQWDDPYDVSPTPWAPCCCGKRARSTLRPRRPTSRSQTWPPVASTSSTSAATRRRGATST